ncbi:MAG TPA: sulfite exporter TauE/SafE family protein [Acidimicrobiia bacterium]|jgi:uncharacterized membrane protein YfcA|nr:sulfite exporter TauE/SafE family protein [Acidimicrobiia bacterium]
MDITPLMVGAICVLAASLIVGLTGFGFNLLSVPLLTLFFPAKSAVVIALVAGSVINMTLAFTSRQAVRHRLLGTILLGSFIGLSLGALGFVRVTDAYLKLLISILTGSFGVRLLVRSSIRRFRVTRGQLVSVGMLSGTLTAMTGMGGPPLAIYLTRALSNPSHVRSTIAAHSSIASLVAIAGFGLNGALESTTLQTGAVYVLPGLVGLALGSRLFRGRRSGFASIVGVTLLLIGIVSAASAVLALT